jgi:hypothetical protein
MAVLGVNSQFAIAGGTNWEVGEWEFGVEHNFFPGLGPATASCARRVRGGSSLPITGFRVPFSGPATIPSESVKLARVALKASSGDGGVATHGFADRSRRGHGCRSPRRARQDEDVEIGSGSRCQHLEHDIGTLPAVGGMTC